MSRGRDKTHIAELDELPENNIPLVNVIAYEV